MGEILFYCNLGSVWTADRDEMNQWFWIMTWTDENSTISLFRSVRVEILPKLCVCQSSMEMTESWFLRPNVPQWKFYQRLGSVEAPNEKKRLRDRGSYFQTWNIAGSIQRRRRLNVSLVWNHIFISASNNSHLQEKSEFWTFVPSGCLDSLLWDFCNMTYHQDRQRRPLGLCVKYANSLFLKCVIILAFEPHLTAGTL